jgi:hypothetical protein
MQLSLTLDIPKLPRPISYSSGILLTGSCFTEHISERLLQHKFDVVSNPNGILFNPLSVADSLDGYLDGRVYGKDDLFYLNELWNSWDHHTRFSDIDADAALDKINTAQQQAGEMIRRAGWVIVTLGSAFQYYLREKGRPVSNNHRAPAQWFEKRLLATEDITQALRQTLSKLFAVNPSVQVIFTISPVRHIRDGVVDNNRSKARLIESVHTLCDSFEQAYYFPAYEILIDILRDYRFYDIDFVHPNFLATSYVWEQFEQSCIDEAALPIMHDVREIMTARRHRTRFEATEAHKKFLSAYGGKAKKIMEQYPFIDLSEELRYFEA